MKTAVQRTKKIRKLRIHMRARSEKRRDKETYMFIEKWRADGIHAERACRTRALHSLVKPSISRKRKRIIRNSAHDPISQCLIHRIADIIEEIQRAL